MLVYEPRKTKTSGCIQMLQFRALVGLIGISALYLFNAVSLKRMALNQETKSQFPCGAHPRQSFVYAVLYQWSGKHCEILCIASFISIQHLDPHCTISTEAVMRDWGEEFQPSGYIALYVVCACECVCAFLWRGGTQPLSLKNTQCKSKSLCCC